jgi:hypothetical protein
MPSTYSTSLGLELIGNGEQAGTWGTTTNTNLGTLLEQAIAGVQSITLTGGNYTLTDYNGLPDEARNAVLSLTGLLGAPCNVIAPAVEKVYIVRNFSNATVTIKTASGNGVALTNAASAVVFCDGTDFYSATTLNFIDGNLVVTGTTTLGGTLTANSTTVLKGDVFGNSNTGQWYLPVGTNAQRTSSPIVGLMRYNTTGGFYEGWNGVDWQRFLTANQGSYVITYVVVGGGAGGSGAYPGGGGGGGQYVTSTTTATPASSVYTITIGAGGAIEANGSSTTIVGVATSIGGGRSLTAGYGGASGNGFSGGSIFIGNGETSFTAAGAGAGAAANGGSGNGAGSPAGTGGAGGIGAQTLISGTSQYFGGGGGGGSQISGQGGAGGGGGGGAGNGSAGNGGNGTVNTGGGGGGTGANGAGSGGLGGSGIVILSMPTINYTGTTTGSPTVTTTGSNTVLTFTGSGSYTG